ncbi:MAG: GTPase, partial [Gemmatimonas sp.]
MMQLDVAARRLSLDPRRPAFFQDPYAAYARILAESPVVFWEELGVWCFFAHDDVNRLLREERMIVSPVPGTTRDPVDSVFAWHKKQVRIVDTAGMRKAGR